MDMNFLVGMIAAGLGSCGLTSAVAYLLHKRKLGAYRHLQEEGCALEELQARLKKQKASVDSQLGALARAESEAREKQKLILVGLRQVEEAALQKNNALASVTQKMEDVLEQSKREFEAVKQRTTALVALEARAAEIAEALAVDTAKQGVLSQELEALEDALQDLKSELDLYSRIEDFVGFGVFETPEYLHEMPERYEAEIRRVRDQQKKLIADGQAVELPQGIEINGSSKTAAAVLSGQAKLILQAFNLECDALIGKLSVGNFDRTLERMEKIAEGLEKTSASLATGIALPYIDLKFEESRLVYEYKLKKAEKDEEQRLIKEQMREEQKAVREYEKALAEAEKEERIYRNLLEKARQKLEAAHGDEKNELESKILALEAQLKEAEAKEARAKSMAEQTRRGHVYVISNIGSFGEEVYKIGLTRRLDPLDRVRELGDASVPFLFDVHAMILSEDAPALEAALHQRLHHVRVNVVNRRKEFFRVPLDKIKDAAMELAGSEIDFQTTAAADEYYETRRLQGEVFSMD